MNNSTAQETRSEAPAAAPGELRVYEIEARTRYRVLAHSQREALDELDALDDCTPFDSGEDGQPVIEFIASCSVPENEVRDVTDEYSNGVDDFGDHHLEAHRESCTGCTPATSTPTPGDTQPS